MRKIRLGWKFRRFRPLWRHRKEIVAGTLTLAVMGAGILFHPKGIKRLSGAK